MELAALLGNDTLKQRLSALQAKGKLTTARVSIPTGLP